jgi:hypothetical protein
MTFVAIGVPHHFVRVSPESDFIGRINTNMKYKDIVGAAPIARRMPPDFGAKRQPAAQPRMPASPPPATSAAPASRAMVSSRPNSKRTATFKYAML